MVLDLWLGVKIGCRETTIPILYRFVKYLSLIINQNVPLLSITYLSPHFIQSEIFRASDIILLGNSVINYYFV